MCRKLSASLGAVFVLPSAFLGCEPTSDSAPHRGATGSVVVAVPASPAPAPKLTPPPEAAPAETFTIIAGGDVSFGRKTGQRLLRDASFDPFQGVAAIFSTGDLRFVNLESTLSDQNGETEHPTRPLTFTGPPSGARALARAGIELVSVANNHAWDYGKRAYFETLTHLERAGVGYVGGSREPVSDIPARVTSVRGWSTAWLAVTDIWNTGEATARAAAPHVAFARVEQVARTVASARARHDLVLVSYHGGAEYSEHIAREQREFARAVMRAGADAVIGHHPHVPQGVEWLDGRPALYSLGNLVFNQHRDHAWTGRGFLARLRFTKGKPVRVELCPYYIAETGPIAVSSAEADESELYRRHLKRIAAYAGFSEVGAPGDHGCLPVAPRETVALAALRQHGTGARARR